MQRRTHAPTSHYRTHTFPVTSSFLAAGSVAWNMRRPPTHVHAHMLLGNVNDSVTPSAMTINTIVPCAALMSNSQLWCVCVCVFVYLCMRVCVCSCLCVAQLKDRQAHVGAESYINHTLNQLESINVRSPTAVSGLVQSLMLALLQTHHTHT